MSIKFKKIIKRRATYIPKDIEKHKHDYSIKCLLEITNDNIHASGNYYNNKEYHEVLKCKLCNSFIPISSEGNYNGTIFDEDKIDKNKPVIKAKTNQKNPVYDFCNLYEVVFEGERNNVGRKI